MLYEMTFKQYRDYLLENSKYKQTYIIKPEKWEEKLNQHKIQWEEILLNHALENVLLTKVIQSYIRSFNEKRLYSIFRGVYQKGVSDYLIPKKIRDIRVNK